MAPPLQRELGAEPRVEPRQARWLNWNFVHVPSASGHVTSSGIVCVFMMNRTRRRYRMLNAGSRTLRRLGIAVVSAAVFQLTPMHRIAWGL
ncbi:hypothetical protein F5B18DRAFT_640404 [Nemania serpens]|nr:hypothetical protein F5B18DRAFT_640404 [Nemania serpens]